MVRLCLPCRRGPPRRAGGWPASSTLRWPQSQRLSAGAGSGGHRSCWAVHWAVSAGRRRRRRQFGSGGVVAVGAGGAVADDLSGHSALASRRRGGVAVAGGRGTGSYCAAGQAAGACGHLPLRMIEHKERTNAHISFYSTTRARRPSILPHHSDANHIRSMVSHFASLTTPLTNHPNRSSRTGSSKWTCPLDRQPPAARRAAADAVPAPLSSPAAGLPMDYRVLHLMEAAGHRRPDCCCRPI